jgi:hypothetical protein
MNHQHFGIPHWEVKQQTPQKNALDNLYNLYIYILNVDIDSQYLVSILIVHMSMCIVNIECEY